MNVRLRAGVPSLAPGRGGPVTLRTLWQAMGRLLLVGCALTACTSTGQGAAAGSSTDAAQTAAPSAAATATAPSSPAGFGPADSNSGAAIPVTGAPSSVSSALAESGTTASAGPTTGPRSGAVSTAPLPKRATTPVPAPGGGNVYQIVPTGTVSTRPAVPFSSGAAYGNGVTVAVMSVKKATTTAELPGEIAGPGVQLTLGFRNGSSAAIDLRNVVVDLQDASGVSATAMTASPAKPVSGSLAPGATASGTYLYTLGKNFPGPVHLSVSYSAQAPVVLFSGLIS